MQASVRLAAPCRSVPVNSNVRRQEMLTCCPTAREELDHLAWLAPESSRVEFGDVRMRLFRCPSCNALWLWRSTCQGHNDWDQSFTPVESASAFRELVEHEESEKSGRLAKLKALYEANGWEWKW